MLCSPKIFWSFSSVCSVFHFFKRTFFSFNPPPFVFLFVFLISFFWVCSCFFFSVLFVSKKNISYFVRSLILSSFLVGGNGGRGGRRSVKKRFFGFFFPPSAFCPSGTEVNRIIIYSSFGPLAPAPRASPVFPSLSFPASLSSPQSHLRLPQTTPSLRKSLSNFKKKEI